MESMISASGFHLDLDGAWDHEAVERVVTGLGRIDCRRWGPPLRFTTPRRVAEAFYRELRSRLSPFPPFLLYGSGDYHYLSAFWLRRIEGPFTLVSFDNHPDWDIRPPHWCCGSWISRALTLPNLERAVVWGCGNFELEWPNRLFANRRGLREGRLEVRPWAERLKPASRGRWPCLSRDGWREQFAAFARELAGRRVYVTVDIDCLRREEAATNWENGLFEAEEVAWAVDQLRSHAEIAGGDLCGAVSPLRYARLRQRIASTFDHPRLEPLEDGEAAARNLRVLETVWPALTGEGIGGGLRESAAAAAERLAAQ